MKAITCECGKRVRQLLLEGIEERYDYRAKKTKSDKGMEKLLGVPCRTRGTHRCEYWKSHKVLTYNQWSEIVALGQSSE